LKSVPERKEWPRLRPERGGVSYTNARTKRFQNVVMACVLIKNFQNGIPARSVTKMPLIII
jgi:hypothetical protein